MDLLSEKRKELSFCPISSRRTWQTTPFICIGVVVFVKRRLLEQNRLPDSRTTKLEKHCYLVMDGRPAKEGSLKEGRSSCNEDTEQNWWATGYEVDSFASRVEVYCLYCSRLVNGLLRQKHGCLIGCGFSETARNCTKLSDQDFIAEVGHFVAANDIMTEETQAKGYLPLQDEQAL